MILNSYANNMMKPQIVLLTIAAIYHLSSVKASLMRGNFPVCLRYQYDGINTFLEENVETEDARANMKAIEDWIERETQHTQSFKDAQRLRALIQIQNLALTEGDGKCSLSSSRILEKNDRAVGGAISNLQPNEEPKRRIEKLIHHYASQFLKDCDHEQIVKNVKEASMNYVKKIVGDFISKKAREDPIFAFFQSKLAQSQSLVTHSPLEASKFAKSLKRIRAKDPVIIYCSLRELINKAEEKQLAEVEQYPKVHAAGNDPVFTLYRKYAGKPCKEFVDNIENTFGSEWALKEWKKIHKTEDPFYINLTYYYGCKLLLRKEAKMIEGLKKLIYKKKHQAKTTAIAQVCS